MTKFPNHSFSALFLLGLFSLSPNVLAKQNPFKELAKNLQERKKLCQNQKAFKKHKRTFDIKKTSLKELSHGRYQFKEKHTFMKTLQQAEATSNELACLFSAKETTILWRKHFFSELPIYKKKINIDKATKSLLSVTTDYIMNYHSAISFMLESYDKFKLNKKEKKFFQSVLGKYLLSPQIHTVSFLTTLSRVKLIKKILNKKIVSFSKKNRQKFNLLLGEIEQYKILLERQGPSDVPDKNSNYTYLELLNIIHEFSVTAQFSQRLRNLL